MDDQDRCGGPVLDCKLSLEVANLRSALADERDETMWRFWCEKANDMATKNLSLRVKTEELSKELDAMTKERDAALAIVERAADDYMDAAAGRTEMHCAWYADACTMIGVK